MGRRQLKVDWQKIAGASLLRKKLILRPNSAGVYKCPDAQCLHTGFKSSRGCRKHVDNKHKWIYHFDTRPNISIDSLHDSSAIMQPVRCNTNIPSFSVEDGAGLEFKKWLNTPCGGGKCDREAIQSSKRAMKFFMYCTGNSELCDVLTSEFIDCCMGSASMIVDFLKMLQIDLNMGHGGAFNYLKSLEDFMDFRKCDGVSDNVLRAFAMTEVYIRRGKRCLSKKKRADWTRNFDLETLISKNSWATVDEMDTVVPYHLPRFKDIISKCKVPSNNSISISDLTFATRFITTYLFLNVKCSRPMTFQRLTLAMIEKAKKDGGYVDQKEFKTADKFLYDTVIFSNNDLAIVNLYIEHCRPLLNPQCNYLLLNSNGKMCTNLCHSMIILVYAAIGKHIHPTRYRQIIETASSENLNIEEQAIISKDQKHSSNIAEVSYKKRLSREIAKQGKECMEKLTGQSRIMCNEAVNQVVTDLNDSTDAAIHTDSAEVNDTTDAKLDMDLLSAVSDVCSNRKGTTPPPTIDLDNEIIDNDDALETDCQNTSTLPKQLSIDPIKTEVSEDSTTRRVPFSKEEDQKLSDGIKLLGKSQWARILKDGIGIFHESRTRDALRMRAQTQAFKRKFMS